MACVPKVCPDVVIEGMAPVSDVAHVAPPSPDIASFYEEGYEQYSLVPGQENTVVRAFVVVRATGHVRTFVVELGVVFRGWLCRRGNPNAVVVTQQP